MTLDCGAGGGSGSQVSSAQGDHHF